MYWRWSMMSSARSPTVGLAWTAQVSPTAGIMVSWSIPYCWPCVVSSSVSYCWPCVVSWSWSDGKEPAAVIECEGTMAPSHTAILIVITVTLMTCISHKSIPVAKILFTWFWKGVKELREGDGDFCSQRGGNVVFFMKEEGRILPKGEKRWSLPSDGGFLLRIFF